MGITLFTIVFYWKMEEKYVNSIHELCNSYKMDSPPLNIFPTGARFKFARVKDDNITVLYVREKELSIDYFDQNILSKTSPSDSHRSHWIRVILKKDTPEQANRLFEIISGNLKAFTWTDLEQKLGAQTELKINEKTLILSFSLPYYTKRLWNNIQSQIDFALRHTNKTTN